MVKKPFKTTSNEEILKLEKLESFIKSQELESFMGLTRDMAHDFNNLLSIIYGNLQLLKTHKDDPLVFNERLNEAEKAVMSACDLTNQIHSLAKGDSSVNEIKTVNMVHDITNKKHSKKTASIKEILIDSTNFDLRGSNIQINLLVDEDLKQVEFDRGQISQVVQNLVINAKQAMPEGGIINIYAENVFSKKIDKIDLSADEYIKITVKDFGIGISDNDISNIFNPSFTTKDQHDGLGLTSCYSIVKQHKGLINVESDKGKGATFRIYLPVSNNKTKEQAKLNPLYEEEKVLIVIDDESIGKVLSRLLENIGFEVDGASNGGEAINKCKNFMSKGNNYKLAILDFTISGEIGGKETVLKLRELDPKLKTIVSSDHSNDQIISEYKKHGFHGCVSKPYKFSVLSEVIHDVINA